MIDSLLNVFFRCAHQHTSFPRRPAGAPEEEMYIVCLDCGKHFRYDWERMRIGPEILAPAPELPEDIKPQRKGGRKPRLGYVVAACSLPVLWLIGKAWGWRRSKSGKEQ